jgi:hypothetical protein
MQWAGWRRKPPKFISSTAAPKLRAFYQLIRTKSTFAANAERTRASKRLVDIDGVHQMNIIF